MDRKQTEIVQDTGWLYLVILILFFASMIFSEAASEGSIIGLIVSLVLSDGALILPCLVFMRINHRSPVQMLRLRRIRISTMFLSALYVICWYPMIAAMNAITMIFTDNTAEQMMEEVSDAPFPLVWLTVAFIAPFMEEATFRGVMLSGLKSGGRIFSAIIVQGILFGFLHLNLNQMAYASVLGIAFGILVEATGSLWTSFLGHMLVNTVGVSSMYALKDVAETLSGAAGGEDAGSPLLFLGAAGVMLVVSCITVPLAMLLLRAMSYSEGRDEEFHRIFRRREQKNTGEAVLSLPVILALVLGGIFMIIRAVA